MRIHWKQDHGLADGDIALRARSLVPRVRSIQRVIDVHDYQASEASVLLPHADSTAVHDVARRYRTDQLRLIVVIGIGGSNLGTKAVYDALVGYQAGAVSHTPYIVFVDSIDPAILDHHIRTLIPTLSHTEEVLLISVSKSGGTTETIANTEILLAAYARAFGPMDGRLIVITDDGSPYWQAAEQRGITTVAIPAMVGGRYSVLSPVGLVPLSLAGIAINELRAGAQDILPYCLHEDWEHNPAIQSATITALSYEAGLTSSDTFLFHTELESLGKWYRQLLGESIGKAEKVNGTPQSTGITPTVSIGSTDLHSVGQLYLGGPVDRLTTFVYATPALEHAVPVERMFPDIVHMINGKTTTDIMSAIRVGTQRAYAKANRPFITVELAAITPYELGAFMQWKMLEIIYLGTLLGVNPFDQPSVESYKTETKRILET